MTLTLREMCTYCGCESEAFVAELMADHQRISALANQAVAALSRGSRAEAASTCAEVVALLGAHSEKEERALFAELQAEPLAVDAVTRLEADHRRLQVELSMLANGETSSMETILADLLDHAEREDSDLFPAALQLLGDDAWDRIAKLRPTIGTAERVFWPYVCGCVGTDHLEVSTDEVHRLVPCATDKG